MIEPTAASEALAHIPHCFGKKTIKYFRPHQLTANPFGKSKYISNRSRAFLTTSQTSFHSLFVGDFNQWIRRTPPGQELKNLKQAWESETRAQVSPEDALVLLLLHEASLGAQSAWAPYLKRLLQLEVPAVSLANCDAINGTNAGSGASTTPERRVHATMRASPDMSSSRVSS